MRSFYIWKNSKEEFALQTSGGIGSGVWSTVGLLLQTKNGEKIRIELQEHEEKVSVDGKWKMVSEIKIPVRIETYNHEKLDL